MFSENTTNIALLKACGLVEVGVRRVWVACTEYGAT
jgi:hypothetical protein